VSNTSDSECSVTLSTQKIVLEALWELILFYKSYFSIRLIWDVAGQSWVYQNRQEEVGIFALALII